MERLGERLREVREDGLGMGMREAARLYGDAEHTTIGNWERETTKAPAAYVAWLAELAGYSVAWILYGTGPKRTEEPKMVAVKLELIRWILAQPTLEALDVHPAILAARKGPARDNPDTAPSEADGSIPTEEPPEPGPSRKAGSG